MGKLIWHEYAHYVAVTAAVYAVWAGYWGIFYRKFFWDFTNGIFRDPGGIQPADNVAFFITIIVKTPLVQISAMLHGMVILAIELGPPPIKRLAISRNLVLRMVLLIFLTLNNSIYYQGINAAIYSFIAAVCYARGIMLGEVMEEAKENRGKGGRV